MAVDQAELAGRHAELEAGRGDAQVTRDGQLEPAAERMPVDRGEGGEREALDRLDRAAERVRDEALRLLGKDLIGNVADVVAGREHSLGAGDDHAARLDAVVELLHRGRDRVEDVVVERVALAGVADLEPRDSLRGPVEDQLPRSELSHPVTKPERLLAGARQFYVGCSYSRTTNVSPSLTAWPSSTEISLTVPASSASTGISIFIDSRITTVSPSSTESPTATSIFQTVPVM